MGNLLIRVKTASPCIYEVKEHSIDTLYLWFDYGVSLDFGRVVINSREINSLSGIAMFALEHLLNTSGNIIIRSEILGLQYSINRFTNLIRKLITLDQLEFFAQCTNDKYRIPFLSVKTMLIGISRQKVQELAGKVRFISMPDRLEMIPGGTGWFYSGVPFTREECLAQSIHNDVPNQQITELHPWLYLPLNTFPEKESQELGDFMELSPETYPEKVIHGIDHNKFGIGDIKLFDDYRKVLKEADEKFAVKKKPFYLRKIVTDSAIIFRNYSRHEIESLLIRDPLYPIFVNQPRSDSHEPIVSIQVKPECRDIADIEYIYLETRKRDFMSQFFYYEGMMHSGATIKSSTILRARIKKLPSLDVQRKIVQKEKEKYFSEKQKLLDSHMVLLNYEEERRSLDRQMSELDARLSEIRKGIVDSDPGLKKVIGACVSINKERRKEAEDILYYLLPIRKCLEEGNACSAPGYGNKSRILIECVIHTLKSMNVIPGSFDVSKSVKHLCRKITGWSSEIPEKLQDDLTREMYILNELSHKETEEKPDQIIKILSLLADLMEWLKEFTARNSDIDRNFRRWGISYEQITPGGEKRLIGVSGVVTSKWISREGALRGSFMKTFDSDIRISISTEKTLRLGLGYGSIVEVNAVQRDEKWRSEEVTVINNCPVHFRFPPPDPTHFRRERRRNETRD